MQYRQAIPAQVAHKAAILARLMSSVSWSLRGGAAQSIPLLGARWTLSTASDQAIIGSPQARSAHKAALGPSKPKIRETAVHPARPQRPASPTAPLPAEAGRRPPRTEEHT